MPNDSVTVDVVVTLNDQVRFNELLLAMPDVRRRYYLRWAAAILFMPAVGLTIGIAVGFVTDRSRLAAHDILQALWSDRLSILSAWLIISAVLFAMMIVHRASRRWRLRHQSRILLRERHGIDRDDPDMREHARCSFGPNGFRSVGEAGDYQARWASVIGLDETPDLLVVRTGRFTGFILPKRDLSNDQVETIRSIVAANIGRPKAEPWG